MGAAVAFAELLDELRPVFPGASLAEIARGLEQGGVRLAMESPPADLRLTAEDWHEEPEDPSRSHGGKKWVSKSGRVEYGKENPGTKTSPPAPPAPPEEAATVPPEKPHAGPAKKLSEKDFEPPLARFTDSPPEAPAPSRTAPAGSHATVPDFGAGYAVRESGHTHNINPTYHVTTPEGKRMFAKAPHHLLRPEEHQPAQVATEMAANRILRQIGVPGVEEAATHSHGGKDYLMTPLLEGSETLTRHRDRLGVTGSAKEIRAHNPPEELGKMALGSWLVNAKDQHGGNYLIDGGGKVHPIDFGIAFHPHQDTRGVGINPKTDALRLLNLVPANQKLDRDMLAKIKKDRPEIERHLRDLSAHYGGQAEPMLKTMGERLDYLGELADKPDATFGDLDKAEDIFGGKGKLSHHYDAFWENQ